MITNVIPLVSIQQLKTKLEKLPTEHEGTYELEYFPQGAKEKRIQQHENKIATSPTASSIRNSAENAVSTVLAKSPGMNNKERANSRLYKDGIPLVRLRQNSTSNDNSTKDILRTPSCLGIGVTAADQLLRDFFEKQITWLLEEEEGEDFVVMETCSRFHDALVLLDILKEHNMPCVVSFLARRDEPVAISFSKIQIGLDCLMFCLFQA